MKYHLTDGSLELPAYVEESPYPTPLRIHSEQYPAEEGGGSLWFVIIAGFLILLGFGFYWFGRKKQ